MEDTLKTLDKLRKTSYIGKAYYVFGLCVIKAHEFYGKHYVESFTQVTFKLRYLFSCRSEIFAVSKAEAVLAEMESVKA